MFGVACVHAPFLFIFIFISTLLIFSTMLSPKNILLIALALFALSDIPVAFARLGTNSNTHHNHQHSIVHVSSRTIDHSKKIIHRNASHSQQLSHHKNHEQRRQLVQQTGRGSQQERFYDQIDKIVERPNFWQSLKNNEYLGQHP